MNILEAMDATIFGNEAVRQFFAEFEAKWNLPEWEIARKIWEQVPEPIRDVASQNMDPDMLNILEEENGY